MKKTFARSIVIALLLVALFVCVQPAAAQADQPDGLVLPPELAAWGMDMATRGGWLALVIVLDLILGVVCALKNHTFQWQRLADFLTDYGPKVVGWLCLEVLGLLPTEYAVMAGLASALGVGAYAIILISGVGSILTNVQSLGLLPANVPGVKAQG